jgi:hypothetical protein
MALAATAPTRTERRKKMCWSISRSEGQALAAEKLNAKTTASPVSKAANSATVN